MKEEIKSAIPQAILDRLTDDKIFEKGKFFIYIPLKHTTMSVIIRMRAHDVSKSPFWKVNEDGSVPTITCASLAVVDTEDRADPNFVYSNLSPGSYMSLSTINDAAGDQFEQGAEYEIVLTKVKDAPVLPVVPEIIEIDPPTTDAAA